MSGMTDDLALADSLDQIQAASYGGYERVGLPHDVRHVLQLAAARLRGDGEQGQAVGEVNARGGVKWYSRLIPRTGAKLYNRPQPVAGAALRALVAKWRDAKGSDYAIERRCRLNLADELEAALSTQPAPSVPKINPAWSLFDRVEFALRDAGFDWDEAHRVAFAAIAPSEQVAASVAAPEGWRLVPVESTETMRRAGLEALRSSGARNVNFDDAEGMWDVMLAATPIAPTVDTPK